MGLGGCVFDEGYFQTDNFGGDEDPQILDAHGELFAANQAEVMIRFVPENGGAGYSFLGELNAFNRIRVSIDDLPEGIYNVTIAGAFQAGTAISFDIQGNCDRSYGD